MAIRKTPPEAVEQDHKLETKHETAQLALAKHRWHWTLDPDNPDRVSMRQYAKDTERDSKTIRSMVNGYAVFIDQSEGDIPLTLGECILRAALSPDKEAAIDALVKASKGNEEINDGKGWTFTTAKQKSDLVDQITTRAKIYTVHSDTLPSDEIENAAVNVVRDYIDEMDGLPEPKSEPDVTVPDHVPDDIMTTPSEPIVDPDSKPAAKPVSKLPPPLTPEEEADARHEFVALAHADLFSMLSGAMSYLGKAAKEIATMKPEHFPPEVIKLTVVRMHNLQEKVDLVRNGIKDLTTEPDWDAALTELAPLFEPDTEDTTPTE